MHRELTIGPGSADVIGDLDERCLLDGDRVSY